MSESDYANPCAVLSPAESATLDGSTSVRCQPAPPPPAPDPPTLSNTLLPTLLNQNKGNPCPFCSDRASTNALSMPDWPARAHQPPPCSASLLCTQIRPFVRMRGGAPGRHGRGLAHAHSIALTSVAHPIRVERQRGAYCAIHAVNNALQHSLLDEHIVQLIAGELPLPQRFTRRENFHLGELLHVMQNVVPALNFDETIVHMGAAHGATWADTMAARPPHLHHCDSAILTMLPDLIGLSDAQLRAHVTHFVAAVHVLGKWYVLDSAAPGRMYPLHVDAVAHSFDAHVAFFTLADRQGQAAAPRAATRAEVSCLLRDALLPVGPAPDQQPRPPAIAGATPPDSHQRYARDQRETGAAGVRHSLGARVRQAPGAASATTVEGTAAWPTAPDVIADTAEPLHVLLFLRSRYITGDAVNRTLLLADCERAGLAAVSYAQYALERVRDHAADGACTAFMYRLTVTCPRHARQLRAATATFKRAVRASLGCNAVVLHTACPHILNRTTASAAPNTYVDSHGMPRRQRPYGTQHTTSNPRRPPPLVNANPFAALEPDVPAPDAAHVGASELERGDRTKARCHPSRARCARRRLHQLDYVGTLNTRNLGTKDAGSRLNAITDMMSEHRVGVLAVQETKVRSTSTVTAMSELTYCGTTATLQASQATGGVGFLIHRSAEEMVAYYGPRPRASHSSATRKFAAAWARIYGMPQQQTYIWRLSICHMRASPQQYTMTPCVTWKRTWHTTAKSQGRWSWHVTSTPGLRTQAMPDSKPNWQPQRRATGTSTSMRGDSPSCACAAGSAYTSAQERTKTGRFQRLVGATNAPQWTTS